MKSNTIGNNNITAGGDVIFNSPNEQREQGVLEDIFKYVLDRIGTSDQKKEKADKLLHTKQKIELNFKSDDEQHEVKEYFTKSYHKITLIEKYFELLTSEEQSDVHNYSYLKYRELKGNGKAPINILRELFKIFLPDGKEKNPQYINLANALVLFFFDDCTIFEKTEQEKNKQKTLFDEL